MVEIYNIGFVFNLAFCYHQNQKSSGMNLYIINYIETQERFKDG